MKLCSFCKKRNHSNFQECPDSECELCLGASAGLAQMIEKAAKMAKPEWKSFCISTSIPRQMMANEEAVWDFGLGESVKNDYNRRIVSALVKATGMDYQVLKADVKFTFDFSNSKSGTEDVSVSFCDIFIFGRYLKKKAGVSQSHWICRKCAGKGCEHCGFEGKMYDSVEEVIAASAKRIFNSGDAELHSSGREDVDVPNFAGRPFVLEIRKPKNGKKDADLGAIQKEISESEHGIEVRGLKYVSNADVALVSDSHFDKEYEAEVEITGGASRGEIVKILALDGAILEQRTPLRVMHRRSDLVRKRKVLSLRLVSESPLVFRIRAEAGTYIKELINGDGGRTKPSFSEAIGREAKCIKLAVTEIEDAFLAEIVEGKQ